MNLPLLYEAISRLWPKQPPALLTARFEKLMRAAALGIGPEKFARAILGLAAFSVAGVLSSIIAFNATGLSLAVTAMAIPLIIGTPLLHAYLSVLNRSKSSDEELPFLILLSSVLTPYQAYALPRALNIISKAGQTLLPQTRKESILDAAQRSLRTANPVSSINNVALNHPSQTWRNFIQDYVSITQKGGNVSAYLRDQLDLFLNRLRDRWQHVARKTGDIVELSAITLALVPTMAAMTMFAYPGSEALNAIYVVISALPFAGAVITGLIGGLQPAQYDRNPKYPLLVVSLSAPISVALLSQNLGFGTAFLLATLSTLVPATPLAEKWLSRVRNAERNLTRLLRDVQEVLRTGFSPLEAIGKLQPERYGALAKPLALAKFRLEAGMPPSKALTIDHPSWLVRIIFFTFAQACESGGGLSEVQLLTSFTERLGEAKRAMIREASAGSATAIAIPFLSAFGLTTLFSIAQQASLLLTELKGIGTVSLREVLAWGHFASAESSILMGFILSKAAFGTIKSLLFPLILSLSAATASLAFGLMGV